MLPQNKEVKWSSNLAAAEHRNNNKQQEIEKWFCKVSGQRILMTQPLATLQANFVCTNLHATTARINVNLLYKVYF